YKPPRSGLNRRLAGHSLRRWPEEPQEHCPMYDFREFYIDGAWVPPVRPNDFSVTNPATTEVIGVISLGTAADVDRAVAAARRAFETFSLTDRNERLALFDRLIATYCKRSDEIAAAISAEMGAPLGFARRAQARTGTGHLKTARK